MMTGWSFSTRVSLSGRTPYLELLYLNFPNDSLANLNFLTGPLQRPACPAPHWQGRQGFQQVLSVELIWVLGMDDTAKEAV